MIKLLFTFILLLFTSCCSCICYADTNKKETSWGDNSSVFNKGFEEQEAVTDNKLHKTIKMLKERSLSRKQQKIRKEVQPLSPMYDSEHLKNFAQSQSPEDELSQTLTVMIPMQAYNEDGIKIAPGYYKLSCRKLAKDIYVLDLSQGTKRIMTVKAKQTKQDLEQDTISFCNSEIIDNGRIRLMYGSIDLNLVQDLV